MLHTGSCHCGDIAFEVEGAFDHALSCNCSICRRKGSLLAFVPATDFTLTTPKEKVSTYSFNKHIIQHHFCANCGVSPYAEATAPDGTPTIALNLRCVPDVDLDALTIKHWDGASH
jgi:hypothetical protein